MFYISLILSVLIFKSSFAASPLMPIGVWNDAYFEFDEDPSLCAALMDIMTVDNNQSVLDLDYVDGTLYNDCTLNGFTYQGESPYTDAVMRSGGVAGLLNPFEYFDLGVTFDWVVCVGLAGFFPQGTESVFVGNLKRHSTSGILITWFNSRNSSPTIINPKEADEIEAFFLDQGLTRDLVTEENLRSQADPLGFWSQNLYVFRP